jgi:hypothetical protein
MNVRRTIRPSRLVIAIAFQAACSEAGESPLSPDSPDLVRPATVPALAMSALLALEQQKLTASDAAEQNFFGFSVAISGDLALVAAPGDDEDGNGLKSAYVFERASCRCTLNQTGTGGSGYTNTTVARVAKTNDAGPAGSRGMAIWQSSRL